MNGRSIKVMLRVYKHEKTLEREFSSSYDAQGAIELMHKNNPDLIVEPYVQVGDSTAIAISEFKDYEIKDLAYKTRSGIG